MEDLDTFFLHETLDDAFRESGFVARIIVHAVNRSARLSKRGSFGTCSVSGLRKIVRSEQVKLLISSWYLKSIGKMKFSASTHCQLQPHLHNHRGHQLEQASGASW